MKIDLHNFFKFYDEKNPNHVKAIQILEETLPGTFLDDNSEWIKTYRKHTTPPALIHTVLNVPWFPQTDNYRDAQRTCNSSSCAMCLEYFKPGTLKGTKGDDAYIQKVFAVGDTTDHAVQTRVLQSYGVCSEFRYNLSFDDLNHELSSGRPVNIGILHRGTLSSPTGGHILVVRGKTPSGDYVVNDPYGSLNDNYTGPVTNGKGAVYKRSVLEKRWTVDGPKSGWGRVFL